MGDIVAARAVIRAIVEPLKLQCSGYHVDVRLGQAQGEEWLDDTVRVIAEVAICPSEGFPWREHNQNRWDYRGYGETWAQAVEDVLRQVQETVPDWQRLLEEDVELAGRVGGRARATKADYYHDEAVALAHRDDLQKALKASVVDVAAGEEFEIAGHEPGKLRLRAESGAEFWVHRWKFHNYLTKVGRDGVERRIPDPYYEFVTS